VTRFVGGAEASDSSTLGYEDALRALLSLIGRNVLVLFSGTGGPPFVSGELGAALDRNDSVGDSREPPGE